MGRHSKYATPAEAKEAQRIQIRHWHATHPSVNWPKQHSKAAPVPLRFQKIAKPVHQLFRRVPPPVPGSIAFALLYGDRRG